MTSPEREEPETRSFHRVTGLVLYARSKGKGTPEDRHGTKRISSTMNEWAGLSPKDKRKWSDRARQQNKRHKTRCPHCIQLEKERRREKKAEVAALLPGSRVPEATLQHPRSRNDPESTPSPHASHPLLADPPALKAASPPAESPEEGEESPLDADVNPHMPPLTLRSVNTPSLPQSPWTKILKVITPFLISSPSSATPSPLGTYDQEDLAEFIDWSQCAPEPTESPTPTPPETVHQRGGADFIFEHHSPHTYRSSSSLPPPSSSAVSFSQPARRYDQPLRIPTLAFTDGLCAGFSTPSHSDARTDASTFRPPLVSPALTLERKGSRRTGVDRSRPHAPPRQHPYTPRSLRPRPANPQSWYGAPLADQKPWYGASSTAPSPRPPPPTPSSWSPRQIGTPRSDVDLSGCPACWPPAPSLSSAPGGY